MAQLHAVLHTPANGRAASGSQGLDDVLGGGFPRGHFYLLEGEPGTGKTTLALQYAAEGLRRGEKVLYITLSETVADLKSVAKTHGIQIEGAVFVELRPREEDLKPEGQYTVFHPAEIELNDRLQMIISEVNQHKPDRLVIDALSEVRMLANDPLRFRRQVLSLRNTLHRIAQFCCWTTAAAVTLNWNCTVSCMALSCWKKYPGNMAGHGAELKSPSCAGLRFGKVITITLFKLAVWLFSLA